MRVRSLDKDDNCLIMVSGVAVGGNVVFVPYHFYSMFEKRMVHLEYCFRSYIDRTTGKPLWIRIHRDRVRLLKFYGNGDILDCLALEFDTMSMRRNIVKHFAKETDTRAIGFEGAMLASLDLCNEFSTTIIQTGGKVQTFRDIKKTWGYKIKNDSNEDVTLKVIEGYLTNGFATKKGSCGSIFIHNDKSCGVPMCLGMHVGANHDKGYGVVIGVSQEMIMSAFSYFQTVNYEETTGFVETGPEPGDIVCEYDDLPVTFLGRVKLSEQVSIGNDNKWHKSRMEPIVEKYRGPSELAPVILRKTDGESPMKKGIMKFNRITKTFPQDLVDQAAKHVFASIIVNRSAYSTDPKVLDEHEMLNGVGDQLGPIDLSTSPGYPHVLRRRQVGKYYQFHRRIYNTIDID
jgi:hypothetical protein